MTNTFVRVISFGSQFGDHTFLQHDIQRLIEHGLTQIHGLSESDVPAKFNTQALVFDPDQLTAQEICDTWRNRLINADILVIQLDDESQSVVDARLLGVATPTSYRGQDYPDEPFTWKESRSDAVLVTAKQIWYDLVATNKVPTVKFLDQVTYNSEDSDTLKAFAALNDIFKAVADSPAELLSEFKVTPSAVVSSLQSDEFTEVQLTGLIPTVLTRLGGLESLDPPGRMLTTTYLSSPGYYSIQLWRSGGDRTKDELGDFTPDYLLFMQKELLIGPICISKISGRNTYRIEGLNISQFEHLKHFGANNDK